MRFEFDTETLNFGEVVVGAEEGADDEKWNYSDDYGDDNENGARQGVFALEEGRTSDVKWECKEKFR